MQLLPYIYSSFAQYYIDGVPLIRPLVLRDFESVSENSETTELDDVTNPHKIADRNELMDQYMFGDNIFVAPVFAGQYRRRVLLPLLGNNNTLRSSEVYVKDNVFNYKDLTWVFMCRDK